MQFDQQPLHLASTNSKNAMVTLLLDRGADVNCRDNVSSDWLTSNVVLCGLRVVCKCLT